MGDVFSHFYDIDGKIAYSSLRGRTFGMPVDILFNVPYIVGVAGGKLKSEAILGALRGKYINILITDDHAAEKILALDTKKS